MQYLNMLPYQLREASDKNYPVALPLGVIEYHAEHLPLGVDCFTCIDAINRIEKRRPELVVLPPFYYGAASLAVAKPERNGTIQVDSEKNNPRGRRDFSRSAPGRIPEHPCVHFASDGGLRTGNADRSGIPFRRTSCHF